MDDRWLVVGLGNPEAEYGGTRHNIGVDVARTLVERHHGSFSRNKRTRCQEAQLRVGGQRLTVVLPDGYMNNAGGPTQAAAAWVGVDPTQVIVVHDELDLDLGVLRCKLGGSSSHNGVRDVVRALGSRDVMRVRVGIGQPPGRMPGRDYVLKRFRSDEQDEVAVVRQEGADAIESLVAHGLDQTQNDFHGRTGASS